MDKVLAELRWIEGELARVDQARAWLVHRRSVLLAELTILSQPPARTQSPPPTSLLIRPASPDDSALPPLPPPSPETDSPPAARPELSGRAIARLLLAAGAVLVVIAVAVFTVANWSTIGPLGRCAVSLGVSSVMLLGPLPLTRRGLAATAESVAAIGLALTVADAYLVVRLLHLQLDDRPFEIAVLTGTLAGLWAGYGRVSRLRGPWLVAIGLAQVPGLYVVDGLVREFGGPAVAVAGPLGLWLVVSAGAEVLLGAQAHRRRQRAEALTCSVFAAAAWIAGVALALVAEVTGPDLANAGWAAVALAAGAVVGAVLWPRNGLLAGTVPLLAVLAGAALAGLGSPIAVALPVGWRVVAFAGVSAAVVAGARLLPSLAAARLAGAGVRFELVASGAAAILGSAALYVGPSVVRALAGPFPLQGGWAADPAHSAPLNVTAGSDAGFPKLIVLLLLGTVAWLAPAWPRSGRRHPALVVVAVAAGAASVASLPVALHVGG